MLERGKALVICGGEGSGKTTRAREIAEAEGGKFVTTVMSHVLSPFLLGAVLNNSPRTVIVEGFTGSDEELDIIKPLIDCHEVTIERNLEDPKLVKTPHFILTPCDLKWMTRYDHRFEVLVLHPTPEVPPVDEEPTLTIRPSILTFQGKYFNFIQPTPDTIDIACIAHALSNTCRFGGHTAKFYSVAQHCALASRHVEKGFALEALLHDAAEAYTGDVPTPLKQLIPDYKFIEDRVWETIAMKFNLPLVPSLAVKKIDLVLLATEERDLMPEHDDQWALTENVTPLIAKINPLSPRTAEILFMERYRELTAGGW